MSSRTSPAPAPSAPLSGVSEKNGGGQGREAMRRCRVSRARAFRWIHVEWRRLHDETVAGWMLWYAQLDMRQAVWDCEALDTQRVRLGLHPIYLERADAFHTTGALESLYYRAWQQVCGHARGDKPFRAALQRSDREMAKDKLLLDRLRETLRDCWSVEEAFHVHQEDCAERVQAGRMDFAIGLGKLLDEARRQPERYTRNCTDWLVRTWFPLRLWECGADIEEAWSRLIQAAALNRAHRVTFGQFHTAWRNLRSRMKQPSEKG